MDGEFQLWLETWISGAGDFWQAVVFFIEGLLLPFRLYQVAVALAVLLLAWGLARLIDPRFEAWLRSKSGWKAWQLRFLILLRRRMVLAVFALLIWATVGVFASIYQFPSRRQVLVLIATIATAWLLIWFAAQLVRNPVLRRFVVWGMTIYATLHYLGLKDAAADLLEGLALTIGDFRLSALTVLKAVVVTGVLILGARMLSHALGRRIRGNKDISPSVQELSIKGLQITLYGAAFFTGVKAVGFDLTGLAVLSGAIGVGLGFGLQKVVSNLVSGVIILMDKSVKPGDVISLGDTFGWINTLGARYVSVVTRDGKEYLIPNEDLITGQVVNWSHSSDLVRLDLKFGTSYGDDPHRVRAIAIDAATGAPRVLSDPAPVCHIINFGDSSVDYVLRFWIRDPSGGLTNIRGKVYLALWDAFVDNNISIPFPQREVRVLGEAGASGDAVSGDGPTPEKSA
ncbi:mechanosensitive ion channel family protein [Pararhodobacter oceanensis]|uniref:mechanosensitive ion channel family protein n=1 Tax=Pararhodobacter oceanensis TaxID=2172121 RepID=UPI003A8E8F86